MIEKKKSSRAVGLENAAKLQKHLDKIPIDKLPTNQYGKVSRSRVLKELGISSSSVDSNDGILKAFDMADQKIGASPGAAFSRSENSEELRNLKAENSRQKNQIAALRADNQRLERETGREGFFIATGRIIRTPSS